MEIAKEKLEKLVIEVELSKEELELFNEFIEAGCIDREKYIKKYIAPVVNEYTLQVIERYRRSKSIREQVAEANCYFS